MDSTSVHRDGFQNDVCDKTFVSVCDSTEKSVQLAMETILEEIENNDKNLSKSEILKMKDDKYAYTKTDRFTSEIYKLEIGNLPKFFGYGECKKLLSRKLKLKPHKVNVVRHINKAYVTFKTEEDKMEAMEKLESYEHKGKKFQVKNAKPKADAMATSKRPLDGAEDELESKRQRENDCLSSEEILKNTVMPWWNKTYDEQLKEKYETICRSLIDVRKRLCGIDSLDVEIFRWLMQQKKEFNRCCPTKYILPSPVTTGYRNKCGFTIGNNLNGIPDIGFRLGKYRDQKCAVESPACLDHVNSLMKNVTSCFTEYVRKSKLEVYDKQIHKGHLRQLMLRTTQNNTIMAVIAISQQNLTDKELENEQEAIKIHFETSNVHLDTLLFRIVKDESFSYVEGTPAVVVHGDGVIYENLFDLKFRISPDAFFQCNTLGAEVLYSCVRDMVLKDLMNETEFSDADNNKDTTVLDVCCGTGTIGLCLANSVDKVIGIDICKEAIEDAKLNAKLNNISNVEFHCNKAEDQLPDLIQGISSNKKRIVAVVDPPRCGLHHKVIKAIRSCPFIHKLIYVSCSVDQARQNFVDLCRPESKRTVGLPFKPILAQPIDLFPHTAHCELVLLFERIKKDPPNVLHSSTNGKSSE